MSLSLVITSFAFAEEEDAKQKTDKPAAELSGTWVLVKMNGSKLPEKVRAPEITFGKKDKLSGFAGVNRMFGKWTLSGKKLFPGPFGTTRMAGPPEAMKVEHELLQALGKITQHEIKDKVLTLSGEKTKLEFKKKPEKKKPKK
ncbi:MAG: META domain-containing protein [Pirellulales bacterium]|jgi:heat shock protein HslJ